MIKAIDSLKKLSQRFKTFLGLDIAAQIEAGYVNEDLSLTTKGKDALLEKLADDAEYKDHLTSLAKADIAEAEKAKDCK